MRTIFKAVRTLSARVFHLHIAVATWVALFAPGRALSQPPKPPGPPGPIHFVNMTITSISPTNPTSGQKVTINYSIGVIGVAVTPITGIVEGSYQGVSLQQAAGGSAPIISLPLHGAVTGALVIASAPLGQGTITLGFYPPPPASCTRGGPIDLARCRTIPIETITASLTVVAPTVTVRISGTTYSHIAAPDSHDGATPNNGYLCVLHDPGCGWWGNDGKDTYFTQKQLPAGAKLVGVDFNQYWPFGVDSGSGSGAWTWFDSSGSYFAHLNQDVPTQPYVKWNNTCAAGFCGQESMVRRQFPDSTVTKGQISASQPMTWVSRRPVFPQAIVRVLSPFRQPATSVQADGQAR